jgi:protein phosphatase
VEVFCERVVKYASGRIHDGHLRLTSDDACIILDNAVHDANTAVWRKSQSSPDFQGMGTTLVAALINGKTATIINVGDSRCYHITRSDIRRITVDHSLVQMMVDRGELTAEEARVYPGRNYITRAVGTEPTVESDVFAIRLERGDAMLLSSDGLHNEVDDQEILFEVVHGVNNDNCCKRLFDIADKRGSPDNVTCVLVMV